MATVPAQTGSPAASPPAPPLAPAKRRLLHRPEKPIRTAIYLTLLLGCTVLFIYPFLWMVSASLKPRPYVFDNKLVPTHWQPANYKYVFTGTPDQPGAVPFAHWMWNSFYIATLAALTVTITSALVAFGFAYFRFPLRNFLFALVLGSLMLPTAVTLVPTFLIFNHLHLVGTQYPLWTRNLFGSAIYIFLMRQFFLGIPRSLFEAARID